MTSNKVKSLKKSNVKAEPFIKWAGGKSSSLNDIRRFYPEKIKKYCEPFVGGGAVLFDVLDKFSPEEVYISDLNKELVNLYKMIRDDVEDLIVFLQKMQDEYIPLDGDARKEYYYEKREEYNQYIAEGKAKIYGSALFIFLNRTCFNGLYRVNSSGFFNVPSGRYKNPKICDGENLRNVSKSLKNVKIYYAGYDESYDFIDEDTFVYFDPPYRPLTETSSFTSYSKDNFDDKQQIELAKYYKKISDKGAAALLSNSDPKNVNSEDNFFDDLYEDFNIYRIKSKRRINSKGDKRGEITELLISNMESEF